MKEKLRIIRDLLRCDVFVVVTFKQRKDHTLLGGGSNAGPEAMKEAMKHLQRVKNQMQRK